MTFRYRGFRILVTDGGTRPSVGFLFDPMVPGAQCLSFEAESPDATGGLMRRYIDDLYSRESQEVVDQLATL